MKYVKAVKVVSKSVFAAQAGISVYQAGSAFVTDNGNKWGVTGKAGLDIAMGAITVWDGPIGWAVGGVYFVGDMSGWWGDWGDTLKTKKQYFKKNANLILVRLAFFCCKVYS